MWNFFFALVVSFIFIFLFVSQRRLDKKLIEIATQFYRRKWNKRHKLIKGVTHRHRGTWAERDLVRILLQFGIPPETVFHDLYLQKNNGQYSQIDLVVPTKVGIIVFEVKDYSGWIFGSGANDYWTQILSYGRKKYRFYNPVKQNRGHIEALRERLNYVADVPYYSIIVFYGDCELRNVNHIPDGNYVVESNEALDIVSRIINECEQVSYQDKWEVVRILTEAVANGESQEIICQHIENIEKWKENKVN